MKRHLKLRFPVSTLAALMLSLAALPALAATPGAVDPAFNNGTPVVLDLNSSGISLEPYAAAMNPLNGDILWAGNYQNSTSQSGEIAVYKSDGSLDPAVGPAPGGAITLTPAQAGFPGGWLDWYAIAVDDQGRILAAGAVYTSGIPTMILTRFMSGGTLDTSFGANGTGIVTDALNHYAYATGLSLTADGHILVTGEASGVSTTPVQLTVWRFNLDGTADTGFGSSGHVQIAAVSDPNYETCFPALQPDGALIAGCQLNAAGSWKLTRLKADGTVDTGFGTNGFITGGANQQLTGLALAPDGGFVISKLDTSFSPPTLYIQRYLANGTVDPGFTSGIVIGSVPNGVARVPVAVQPDGKILISANGGGYNLAIVRLLADGTGDTSFGSGGSSTIDFSSIGGHSYTPNATALLLQGDGKIVASGWAGSPGIYVAFVTRVLSDTYDLTPTAPTFTDVTRAPLGQALASNAVAVGGETIGGGSSGVNVALVTQNGKYSISGAPFAGGFTATNAAWAPAEGSLALEQMTPSSGGTATTTTVVLGGFWAANNYEVPLGSPATANWTTTTDQPPVANDGTLIAKPGKATTGTLTATNPSSGTLSYAIVTLPGHGTATITNPATGAYSYTSANGYRGADAFTWKVNDGVADSNTATVSVTVKKAPSSGGGGGGFGPLALFGLLLLALVPWWLRHRGFRSTSTRPTDTTRLTEDIPMKHRLKLRFLVSTLAALMLSLAALPALATTPGTIDPGFNGGKPVVLDLTPSATIQPYAAAMNPLNGDILWAGHYQTPVGQGGGITAYKPDGTVDTNFGGTGNTGIGLTADQAGFTGGYLYLYAIAVDGQGRILAAGNVWNSAGTITAMVLARFKPDGTLDTAFNGTGIVTATLNNYAEATGLSLTADGHILVTGDAYDAGGTQDELTVWRFKPDGTADTAFGSNGYVQIPAVNNPFIWNCFPALQPNGALIVGCELSTSWKLTRLKADGTVDTGFGTSGFVTSVANRYFTGLALAPNGGFVISEVDTSLSPPELDMRRYVADGTVDTGFGTGGLVVFGPVPNGTWQVPVAVQPDGKILFSGNDGGYLLGIGRLLANGSFDPSFGPFGGYNDIDFTNIGGYNYTPYPTALLVQGDGRIVASGWADSTAGSGEAAFVTRVLSDPYALTPSALAFNAVTRAPLGQAVASNAVDVNGVNIGGNINGVYLALVTQNGKYGSSTGGPFAGGFTGTNVAWVPAWIPAGGTLALEQMTPTTGGTDTTTTVVLGGFWAANNYEVPLGTPATASWTTTTDQPPVASDGTLIATTAKATTGTLTATNPSSGTLAFAIVTAPAHGTATITNPATGAYTYTSAAGYRGSDAFTWKVNDGVADSNTATVNVTVNAAPPPPPPPSGGGGGGFGPFALLGLLFLTLVPWWLRRRSLCSTPTQPTDPTQLTEDIPMKLHLKLRFPVSIFAALALGFLTLPALAAPGTIDTTFNGGTPVILDMNSSGVSIDPYAAAMNPLNGDILWAGDYQDSTTQDGAIIAYKPDGSFDTGFGGGSGIILLTADQAGFTGGELYLSAIAVDDQGRILAAGEVVDAGYTTWAMVLARFKPDGTLDTTFGANGTGIVTAALNNTAYASGLSLTADGLILVTGAAYDANGSQLQLTVWRFKPDGTPDTAFGGNGYVQITAVSDPWNLWPCLPALQPDGALIVGCQLSNAGSWKLTRLTADGTVDTGFGTGGVVASAANRFLDGLALAPDGGFVISEEDTSPATPEIYMRRYLADGTVDTGFNGGSPFDIGPDLGSMFQVPIAVQPDGKILFSVNDGGTGLFVVRLLANGALDTSFGPFGGYNDIDFTNIGGTDYTPYATALLLQGDGKIVATGWADSTAISGEAAFVTRVTSDTYDLTPTAPAFTAVTRAPLGQALASNAVAVGGETIGGGSSGVNVALVTQNGKYSISGAPFAGGFTATNTAWAPAEGSLALEQMTPTTGGTATTTTVVLGGFWAANNYEVPLGTPATASWTTTTDQPPVASDGTLIATTAKATTGTLTATNPSSGTLAFAIVTAPAHGTVTVTAATGAYRYTSTAGYSGSDTFTWKVNDGVADSNIATVNVTVKKAPPSGGGGGGFGGLGLLALALLGGGAMFRQRRAS